MAANPTGLGKGLDALIRETSDARESGGVQVLLLKDIIPNPNQPRRKFSEKTLEELAASIRSQGVLQPLLVRPCGPAKPGKYEIVAGERRWRASQLAGLVEVPVLIRSFSAQDTLVAALIENLQREDLNPIEEALGIQTLKEEFELSQEDLAKKLGKSRSAIANSLRLLSLPEAIQKDLAEGRLSAGHARSLLSITEQHAQERLRSLIIERHLSVREAEGLAATWKETGTFEPVDAGDPGSGQSQSTESMEPPLETANDNAALNKATEKNKSRPQSARLLDIQTRISNALNTSVRVTGKEDKGRISLSYNSKEELEALLQRLSGNVLEGRTYPALSGNANAALDRQAHPELSGNDHESLDGARHLALSATEGNPALPGSTATALSATVNPVLSGADHAILDSTKRQALQGAHNTALNAGERVEALTPGSSATADK